MTHFKSDGNGGFILSKQLMALISLIILIITSIVPAVAYATGVQNTLESATIDINTNIEMIKENRIQLTECRENIAVNVERYTAIDKRLERIEDKLDRII